jgi:outer membrane protein assembly factor BamB
MKSLTAHRKQTASFRLTNLLAIAPLWLMLGAATAPAHAQGTPSPGDWTQFHRDNMQRWNPYETVLGVDNVGGLGLKWSFAAGSFVNSPAVVNGVAYIGSSQGYVYAVNASTGAKLWSFFTGDTVGSSPAVANGVVYIGSLDHNVYGLNASTGAKLWSFITGNIVVCSPTVVNAVVYVGSSDGNLYALNASTGAKLWSFPSFATAGTAGSSPAVANGVVYVGGSDGNIYALNASTGARLWTFSKGNTFFDSPPAVANGVVYVGSEDGNLYALNASTGAKLWISAIGSSVSSPAVANGVVYVGLQEGGVLALDASTGAREWTFNTGIQVISSPSPAVANGVVYETSDVGNVYALNASTGALLWTLNAGSSGFVSSPVVVNGMVYFASEALLAFGLGPKVPADLFLRIEPTPTTVHQGDLITYAFPVWNLGPGNADFEVLNTQVPAGTTFDYIRISGTPGLGTCTTPLYQGTGQIVCHENAAMAPNTTWTVRVTVKVTAPAGTTITESAATLSDTPDPNMANNMATVSVKVQ